MQGKTGTASILGALLDRGAGGLSSQQIARAVESLGATRFAGAGEDSFVIGMHGLAIDAETLLELLGKMVLSPELSQKEFDRERARMLDQWTHLGDHAESLASFVYERMMSVGTPYARGGFLSAEEFRKVTREDVVAFHRRHFTPKNALFVVVGRVERESFRKKIGSVFGAWAGEAPLPGPDVLQAGFQRPKGQSVIVVNRPGLSQAQVRMGFRAPLITSPDRYPLMVLNALTGEYFYSRLNALIREQMGLTYGIGSSFSYLRDSARFTIGSATQNETAGKLVRKTLDVLETLKRGEISSEEITMAKDYLKGSFPLSVSTLGAVASRWMTGTVFGLGPEYLNEFIPRTLAVQREQVLAAARAHLKLDEMLIVVAGDAREIVPSLNSAGFKPAKVFQVKELIR